MILTTDYFLLMTFFTARKLRNARASAGFHPAMLFDVHILPTHAAA